MKYNFDEIVERRGSYSSKWDGKERLIKIGYAERYDDDTIPVFLADMDFACPQPIIDALHKTTDQRIFGYTGLYGQEYFDAIINWFWSRNQWRIKQEEIVYINGSVNAVSHVILAFTKPGEGVIIQRPVYGPFTRCINRTGRKVVDNRLIEDQGYYTIDFALLEQQAADPNNTLLILCNPHNPVGRAWNLEELQRLAEICERHGVLILADEIHGDILRKGQKFYPLAAVVKHDKIITCTAINKTFNLAGLHCSNLIIQNPQLLSKFQEYLDVQPVHGSPTPFAISALIAAYNESGEWLEQLNAYIDDNIDWVIRYLAQKLPTVKVWRPEATYIMWLDFRGYKISRDEIRDRIYRRANVVLEEGALFDPDCGEGFERLCVPAPRALIAAAMERIYEQFKDLEQAKKQ